MKKRKSLQFKFKDYEDIPEEFDYEKYCELIEEGLHDKEIARELNISEKLLRSIKKEVEEDY